MCGICGTVGFDGAELVERMNRGLTRRGPDDIGVWRDNGVSLGHTRLSIIDLSSAGHQPMSNEDDSIWITFNGEIYNFQNLRPDLEKKGHRFKSKTDTEVILHLYEEYGEKCLDYLRGMFAFAIWDKNKNELFAARDRLGIKPFFYSLKDKTFIFCSGLKALLSSGFIKKEINQKALMNYFIYGSVPMPHTLIKDIFQLKPAHYLIFKNAEIMIKRYWKIDFSKVSHPRETESEYISDIRTILDDAVRIRLITDVPLGAFLSGGVDSSAVTALMQKHSPLPIKTFSIIFEEKEYDERKFSGKLARVLGTEHTEILLKEEDILKEIPIIFDAMEQPSIDGFNTYIISQAVKRAGLKVALSGLGGDEIFAGYSSFRTLPKIFYIVKLMKIFPQVPKDKLFELLMPLAKTRFALKGLFSVLKCEKLEDLSFLKRMVFLPIEVSEILTTVKREQVTDNTTQENIGKIDAINQLSFLELTTYLQNMLLQDTDQMSMANSLEVRVPFLDHLLVEKLFEIPGSMKIKRGYPKYLLVKATEGLLPEEIYERPKMGFVFPFERWLKGKLKCYCEEKFSKSSLKNINFLNSNKVNRIWSDFLKGSKLYNYSSILSLLSFINWYSAIQIPSPRRGEG